MGHAQRAERDWGAVMRASVLGLQAWRAGHASATFAAIEAEVDLYWLPSPSVPLSWQTQSMTAKSPAGWRG
jgi:hypothetical protein